MSRCEARGAFLVRHVGGLGVLFADGFAFGAQLRRGARWALPDDEGRFFVNDEDPAQVVLIQNWFEELQRLVPTP